jgi:hypothetical protein
MSQDGGLQKKDAGVTSPETTRSLGLNVFFIYHLITLPCSFSTFSPGPKAVQFTFSPGKGRGEEGPEDYPRIRAA